MRINKYIYNLNQSSKWPMTYYKVYKLNRAIFYSRTYAEYFEDLILYRLLFDIEKGFYIDIGAYDPNKVSVTKLFYQNGWHGINIEPLPHQFELFEKERPDDINLQYAVGQKKRNVTFYINDQSSTVEKKYSNGTIGIINVTMDNMNNICRKYVPNGTEIDFCKIDVEGSEKDVLLGYDFINYRPKVFCIESTIPGSRVSNHKLWRDILINNNYSFIYKYGVNRYYVDDQIPELKKRAKFINKFLIKYIKRKYKRRKILSSMK